MSLISLSFAIIIIILAGRIIYHNKFIDLDAPLMSRLAQYFAAGTVVISLFMLFLSAIGIRFSIVSISVPFVLYLIFITARYKHIKIHIQPFNLNWIFLVALTIIVLNIISVTINSFLLPVFRADAIGGWVFKAKVFYEDKAVFLSVFRNLVFNNTADYPLLVPLNLTWIAVCLQSWQDTTIRLFFILQYIAGIIFFYYSLKETTEPFKAILATLVVFSIPALMTNAETAYVDCSLAFYVLFSTVYLFKWLQNNRTDFLLLSAFFIGAAAWTKNDGIGLFIAMLFTTIIYYIPHLVNKKETPFTFFKPLLLFILVSLCIFMPYKILVKINNINSHMSIGQSFKLSNINRLPILFGQFLYEMLINTPGWLYFWIFFLIILYLCRGSLYRSSLKYIFLFILISIFIYFAVYLCVNQTVFLYSAYTVDRLLLGLAPSAGFLMFTVAFRENSIDDMKTS
jgi:hypothetical protein